MEHSLTASLVLSTLLILSEWGLSRELSRLSSIRSSLISELRRGIFIITLEFWHQLPLRSFCSYCFLVLKLLHGLFLGCLIVTWAVFLVLNLWSSVIRADVIYSYVTFKDSFYLRSVDFYYRLLESCSIHIELFILILDHVYQEWSTSSIVTRTTQCVPILRDQTLNTVIVTPDRSVEKPVLWYKTPKWRYPW